MAKAKVTFNDIDLTVNVPVGTRVIEVSEKVGFSDSNYFSSLFKKQVGMSPLEYREGGIS